MEIVAEIHDEAHAEVNEVLIQRLLTNIISNASVARLMNRMVIKGDLNTGMSACSASRRNNRSGDRLRLNTKQGIRWRITSR